MYHFPSFPGERCFQFLIPWFSPGSVLWSQFRPGSLRAGIPFVKLALKNPELFTLNRISPYLAPFPYACRMAISRPFYYLFSVSTKFRTIRNYPHLE